MSDKTLYVIDFYAQLFRAYHAIRGGMQSPVTKEPTNATFGYIGMLFKVLREYKPDYLVVATDVSGDRGTFRSEFFPEYKANREPPPSDFHPQSDRCLAFTRLMNIPVLGVERYEADDVIASLVTQLRAKHPDLSVRIVSKDKDLEQLLDERVALADVHKDLVITVDSLRETKGVEPSQVIDMLALMGDTVDNVPGVKGIGPKTAAQLIGEHGSIATLLENLDKIKGKRRENIEAAREALPLSQRLVTLVRDLELDFDLDRARVNASALPASDILHALQELGFNRHQDELRELTGIDAASQADAPSAKPAPAATPATAGAPRATDDEPGLFTQSGEDAPEIAAGDEQWANEPKRGTYTCITTKSQLAQLCKSLRKAKCIAVDTETTGLDAMTAHLCGLCISTEQGSGDYIPVRSPDTAAHCSFEEVIAALKPILEDASIPKVGHHLKYDLTILRRHGIALRGIVADTMIASFVVDSSRPGHGMDALAQALLDYHTIPISSVIGKRARGQTQRCFDEVALETAAPYAAEDADITLRLWDYFEPKLKAMKLRSLFDDLEMPIVEVLAEMEFNGIIVDPDILDAQRESIVKRIEQLRQEIIDAAPHAFNPDSPKQLAAALFNKPDDDPPGLGIKVLARGKTGPSTRLEVLEKLADDPAVETPIPTLIVEYRQLTKLVNTYLVALKESINKQTGRIHASFHQTVAATGRLASSDPNLQNIPVRTDIGRQIRKAFIAPPGYQLITADYSQVELRLLAHLSGDEALIEAFRNDEDIHTAVASQVFNTPIDEVSREQRDGAKMVNFGIVYGITAFGLARRLGKDISNSDAQKIIDDYKAKYPRIDAFLEQCKDHAKRLGYVETMLKRRRAVPQIESRNPQERNLGERIAINSVVQGSAADLIKLAMIDLHRRLPNEFPGVKMLLQIHDELVFECPDNLVEKALPFITARMENAMQLTVPLKVSAAAAKNWLEGK